MIRYSATRMELLRLRRRLLLARRGHQLLQDKLDELMREFLKLVREEEKLREETEKKFVEYLRNSMIQGSFLFKAERERLYLPPLYSLKTLPQRVMNVSFPRYELENISFPPISGFSPVGSEKLEAEKEELMKMLIKLAELERGIVLLGDEIKRTRRKVNALEHRFIPELEKAIKYISFKLSELEKEAIIRLMKIKEKIRGE